jgi:hypothetical protein
MSARRLSAREIDHMAEQAADRSPQHVQNPQGLAPGHGSQNQRSEMMTVSPGRTGYVGGTFWRTVRPSIGRLIST